MKTNMNKSIALLATVLSLSAVQMISMTSLSQASDNRHHHDHDYEGTVGLKDVNDVTDIALRAIELTNELQGASDYQELGRYLLPIKKAAARAYALGRARSEFSPALRQAMVVLERAIGAAGPYIEDHFEQSDSFETATELLTLQEQIRAVLE